MTEWPRLRRLAVEEGLQVLAWRSPEINEAEWRAAAEKANWSEEEAASVVQVPAACRGWVGHPNHFPFTRVVDPRGVVSWPIWGVLPDAAWRESLRWRRGMLARHQEDGGS